MTVHSKIQSQKAEVAQLIFHLCGSNSSELCSILERELREQTRYDHREIQVAEIDAIWQQLPPIASYMKSETPINMEALKASSYAFRLMTLSQCLKCLPTEGNAKFQKILDEFGLGEKEVHAYMIDFAK